MSFLWRKKSLFVLSPSTHTTRWTWCEHSVYAVGIHAGYSLSRRASLEEKGTGRERGTWGQQGQHYARTIQTKELSMFLWSVFILLIYEYKYKCWSVSVFVETQIQGKEHEVTGQQYARSIKGSHVPLLSSFIHPSPRSALSVPCQMGAWGHEGRSHPSHNPVSYCRMFKVVKKKVQGLPPAAARTVKKEPFVEEKTPRVVDENDNCKTNTIVDENNNCKNNTIVAQHYLNTCWLACCGITVTI